MYFTKILLSIVFVLFASTALAAKLTPISSEQASGDLFICESNPSHFILSHGDWTACCYEDAQTLETTCTVCDKDKKNCSAFTEFSSEQELFNLMELGPALELAPVKSKDQKYKSK